MSDLYWGGLFPESGGGGGSGISGVYTITGSPVVRFTPVIVRITITGAASLYITYKSGGIRYEIYNPIDGFIGAWGERSTVVVDGADLVITLLPNGGWWSKTFEIKFVAGVELTPL